VHADLVETRRGESGSRLPRLPPIVCFFWLLGELASVRRMTVP